MRLCQRFAHRHGFSRRTPNESKQTSVELEKVKEEFSLYFWGRYGHYSPDEIYNVDETGVYYDMPPHRIWAHVGGSARVNTPQRHSVRVTAVLTVRSDGKKLPILFIVRGQPGGTIERDELPRYPRGETTAYQCYC